jgi:hypothetical protein
VVRETLIELLLVHALRERTKHISTNQHKKSVRRALSAKHTCKRQKRSPREP